VKPIRILDMAEQSGQSDTAFSTLIRLLNEPQPVLETVGPYCLTSQVSNDLPILLDIERQLMNGIEFLRRMDDGLGEMSRP